MERKIRILIDGIEVLARLDQTPTADRIWEALPLEGEGDRWGKEIYFEIPLRLPLENGAKDLVKGGGIAYWPPGNAFCIFWGPTPASREHEVRAASPVNVFGKVIGDLEKLNEIKGLRVRVEKLKEK